MADDIGSSLGSCPTTKGKVMSWYYCLEHQQVEPEAGCPNAERMGPYATEADAAAALKTAHERNEAFDGDDD